MKARLKKRGMRRRALKLTRNYLYKRFLRVVNQGDSSSDKEIFSSVPQGGKWSPPFWNFDVSEMDQWISDLGELICYADDNGMWYDMRSLQITEIIWSKASMLIYRAC